MGANLILRMCICSHTSYPHTFFLLQNLKHCRLCGFTSALLASLSMLSQTECIWRINRACHPSCALHSWLPQPSLPGQGSLWHPPAEGCGGLPWVTKGRIWPDLHVHTDCSSGGSLMGSVYSSSWLKHSPLQQEWGTSSKEWGSTSSGMGGFTSPLVIPGALFPFAPNAWTHPGPLCLSPSHPKEEHCAGPREGCVRTNPIPTLSWMLLPSDLSKSWLSQRKNLPQIQWIWGWIPDPRHVLLQRSLESRT